MCQRSFQNRTSTRTLTCPYPTPLSPSPYPSRLASPHPTSRFVLTPTIPATPTDLPSSTILAALASVDGAQDVWRSIPVTSLLHCLLLQTRPTRSAYTGPASLFFVVGGCPRSLVAVARQKRPSHTCTGDPAADDDHVRMRRQGFVFCCAMFSNWRRRHRPIR